MLEEVRKRGVERVLRSLSILGVLVSWISDDVLRVMGAYMSRRAYILKNRC